MLILVTGGNGSGKSRFAESLASRFKGKKYYAATMIPYGAEGAARKARHIRQRQGLGFVTVECPYSLDEVPAGKDDLTLLEDVSNLLANAMFESAHRCSPEKVNEQIIALEKRSAAVIAVTIGGLTGNGCDAETRRYVAALNDLNAQLAARAVTVVELREGEPFFLKGECPWTS